MKNFDYVRPTSISDAIAAAAQPGAVYLAAGTNLLDLMKGGISRPDRLVGILAARLVGKPVKLVLSREQMHGPVGHRSASRQRLRIGLERDEIRRAVTTDHLVLMAWAQAARGMPARAHSPLHGVVFAILRVRRVGALSP